MKSFTLLAVAIVALAVLAVVLACARLGKWKLADTMAIGIALAFALAKYPVILLRMAWGLVIDQWNRVRYGNQQCLANVAEGTTEGGLKTFLASAAMATRYYVVKKGADSAHIAVSASATDVPLGIAQDEATAAEDPVTVQLFGSAPGTMKVVVSVDVVVGDILQSNGDGRAKKAVSTGYCFGRVVADAVAGDLAEFDPVLPINAQP